MDRKQSKVTPAKRVCEFPDDLEEREAFTASVLSQMSMYQHHFDKDTGFAGVH